MRNIGLLTLTLTTLLVVAVIGSPMPSVSAQDTLTSGTPVEGSISGDEGNTYTISATMGQLITLNMESDEFDTYLTLSDANGTELATNDDGGEGTNALLAYVAQADGIFTVTATSVWGGTGAYTLTPFVVDPATVELDGSVTLTPDSDTLVMYAVFAADSDTVVNVWATSQGEDSLEMELFGVAAESIETDYTDGPNDSPYVRRVVLPESGLYLIAVTNSGDELITAPMTVHVEATDRLFLTDTPQAVALSEGVLTTEVFTFDATAGAVYRITVTSELGTGVAMKLFDTMAFFNPDFETDNAVKVTWEWLSDVDGPVRLDVHPSFFSDGDNFTFMIETVQ